MIPDETVDLVRESADIVQVIGDYVSLKRVGADWRGPCPFHQGKHRNFSVSPKKRMYYCFVCHEGGDVFNFLQKRLGVDWPAAVKMVAEKSGIEVREVDSRRGEGPDPRERFWEVNAAAAEWFQRQLRDEETGRAAREYLAGRRIDDEVATRFQLGFAPRDPAAMRSYLASLGFDDARLLEAGLLVKGEEDTEARARFRGRLIFPILDAAGRHVGFGGRLLGPGEPKYLNSAESAVYSKGKLLYNLNAAKHAIRRDERVLIVEGYFDVVRLVAAGIESVVAPLGTALTEAQAALILRYTKNVYLLYDSDKAGLKATFRAGDELLRHGMAVQVVTLPEGEDPDSFVDRAGAAGLETQIAGAIDVFERKLQLLERGGWLADLRRKRRAADRLLPTIRATRDPLTRDLYLTRASEMLGVSRDTLEREAAQVEERSGPSRETERIHAGVGEEPPLGEPPAYVLEEPVPSFARAQEFRFGDRRRGDRRTPPPPPSDKRPIRVRKGDDMPLIEADLTRIMLHVRSQVEVVASRVGVDTFRDARYRAIFTALRDLGAEASVDELADALDEPARQELQRLLAEPGFLENPQSSIEGGLARLREREIDETIKALQERLNRADPEEKNALMLELKALSDERKRQGARRFKLGQRFH